MLHSSQVEVRGLLRAQMAALYPQVQPVSTLGQDAHAQTIIDARPMVASPASHLAAVPSIHKTVVLVGMMGAGKSAIGRRLAKSLDWPFTDADTEIETAAGTTIANIFEEVGEAAFRQSERHVIARLLQGERQVLALGGGAFVDPATRALVREHAVSIWLHADLDVLVKRTARRTDRPLLAQGDPRAKLTQLLEQRMPIYAEADLIVDSSRGPINAVVARALEALAAHAAHAAHVGDDG